MVTHRSMRGRSIDMVALMGASPDTIAVTGGGTLMNARGDILGPGGKIVKKIEQIQDEYNKINPGKRERISVADTENMKRFALKKRFMTPEEVQENLAKMEVEKKKAKKMAEKVVTATEMLAQQGPIITNYEEENKKAKKLIDDDESVLMIDSTNNDEDSKKPKGRRIIVDKDE